MPRLGYLCLATNGIMILISTLKKGERRRILIFILKLESMDWFLLLRYYVPPHPYYKYQTLQ